MPHNDPPPPKPVVAYHMLGIVDFDVCLALQKRLAYEAGERVCGRVEALLCEHPELITVGRAGSRAHIRLDKEELARRRLAVRWVSRSGGCVLHGPGQLAVYPIVPLARFGWTTGHYLGLLRQACLASLAELSIRAETRAGASAMWGRSGQLAAIGVTVRHGVTTDGLFINVNPASTALGFVDAVSPQSLPVGVKATMGSLLAERRRAVKMTAVRAEVVANLAAAFGCERYHLHTGHPHLPRETQVCLESSTRHA